MSFMADVMGKLAERYPKTIKLPKGLEFSVRPLKPEDEGGLAEFFRALPIEERMGFNDDVSDAKVIKKWCTEPDFDKVLPLLAIDIVKVVADVTLHFSQKRWSRHVANVRVSVHPHYRGKGLATALIKEVIGFCEIIRIPILNAEVLAHQRNAARVFEDLEFDCIATLPAQVLDLTGTPRDVLIYSYTVFSPHRFAAEHTDQEEVDIGGGG